MKKLHILLSVAVLTICTVLFINSCKKDDNNNNNSNSSSGTGSTYKTSIAGIIIDENNNLLSGVIVTAHGQTTSTDANGTFVFDNISVPTARCIVMASKTSYLNATFAAIPHVNNVTYFKIVMLSAPAPTSFSSSAGAIINLTGGAIVQLPVNGYVNASGASYTGTVNAIARYLSPSETNFSLKIPGGDLLATDSTNKNVILYSYGMVTVQLTDNALQPLQLANGSTAILTLPVIASQSSTAPASMPLWYFDETTSLWKQQGQATKIGNNYVGSVAHFSTWNCDQPQPQAYLNGRVVDCQGNPVPNVIVTIDLWSIAITDNNGVYHATVTANATHTVQVLSTNNNGVILNSQQIVTPMLSTGQIYNVADLNIPCITRVSGTITGCNNANGNGIVYVTWAGGHNYMYCNSENYSIPVPASTSLVIQLYAGSVNSYKNITSGAAGVTTNIGNTVLCNNGIQPDNSFYINGNGYNNRLIIIDTTVTVASWNSSLFYFFINVQGIDNSNGMPAGFTFYLNDTIPGNHTLNYTNGNSGMLYDSVTAYVNVNAAGTSNCILTQVQSVGGRVIGSFSGTLAQDSSGFPPLVTITNGKFNVPRTQ